MSDYPSNPEIVLKRPDDYKIGDILPHIYPSTIYRGTGMLNVGGQVFAQSQTARWETMSEFKLRTGKI